MVVLNAARSLPAFFASSFLPPPPPFPPSLLLRPASSPPHPSLPFPHHSFANPLCAPSLPLLFRSRSLLDMLSWRRDNETHYSNMTLNPKP